MSEIYSNWDYRYVRAFALTVDRDLYETGKEAYFAIQREKELAEFMRRLKRRLLQHGVKIYDYQWVLEWHKDGFPHWHCLVLLNKKGKAGRIATKIDLTGTWGKAKFIKEGYIHDAKHWAALAGYVSKHGYFGDGKKDQARLPEWAREMPLTGEGRIRIKRMERMRQDYRNGAKPKRGGDKLVTMKEMDRLIRTFNGSVYNEDAGDFEEVYPKASITWGESLDSCGAKSLMTVHNKVFLLTMQINIPYKDVKEMGGEYYECQGWVIPMESDQILKLLEFGEEVVKYSRVEFDTFDDLEGETEMKPRGMEQTYIPFPF